MSWLQPFFIIKATWVTIWHQLNIEDFYPWVMQQCPKVYPVLQESGMRGRCTGLHSLACWHFPFLHSFPECSLDTLSCFTAPLLTSWQGQEVHLLSYFLHPSLFFIRVHKSKQVWISYFRLARTHLSQNNPPRRAETLADSWYRPMVSTGSDIGF